MFGPYNLHQVQNSRFHRGTFYLLTSFVQVTAFLIALFCVQVCHDCENEATHIIEDPETKAVTTQTFYLSKLNQQICSCMFSVCEL